MFVCVCVCKTRIEISLFKCSPWAAIKYAKSFSMYYIHIYILFCICTCLFLSFFGVFSFLDWQKKAIISISVIVWFCFLLLAPRTLIAAHTNMLFLSGSHLFLLSLSLLFLFRQNINDDQLKDEIEWRKSSSLTTDPSIMNWTSGRERSATTTMNLDLDACRRSVQGNEKDSIEIDVCLCNRFVVCACVLSFCRLCSSFSVMC